MPARRRYLDLPEKLPAGGARHQPGLDHFGRHPSQAQHGVAHHRWKGEQHAGDQPDHRAEANRFIRDVFLPDHNARFTCRPELEDSAFVPLASPGQLTDIVCIRHARTVERDNTVRYAGSSLQLPQSPLRPHYVKAKVQVHEYPGGSLAIFHGPRKIAGYDQSGNLITPEVLKNAA